VSLYSFVLIWSVTRFSVLKYKTLIVVKAEVTRYSKAAADDNDGG